MKVIHLKALLNGYFEQMTVKMSQSLQTFCRAQLINYGGESFRKGFAPQMHFQQITNNLFVRFVFVLYFCFRKLSK